MRYIWLDYYSPTRWYVSTDVRDRRSTVLVSFSTRKAAREWVQAQGFREWSEGASGSRTVVAEEHGRCRMLPLKEAA